MAKIALVFPSLPPSLDGIGDYTAHLAGLLSEHADTYVLTAQEHFHPIPGVQIERAFSIESRRGVRDLGDAVRKLSPDWLVLQFEQFSYGRWGLNPYLPSVVEEIKRTCPGTHVALMAHEDFVPVSSWKFAVMTTWQRWQFWRLGRASDLVLCSVEPWVFRYQNWFPETPVRHAPVASNVPRLPTSGSHERKRLGVPEDACVLGLFGTIAAVRDLDLVRATLEGMRDVNAKILYVGAQGERVRSALEGWPIIDAGPLPAEGVSRSFSAIDIYMAPFYEGVSSRRGSFMIGLQHGVPTVTTHGPETGTLLEGHSGEAFISSLPGARAKYSAEVRALWEDSERRARIGKAGQRLYDEVFAWDVLSHRLLRDMSEAESGLEDRADIGERSISPSIHS